MPPLPGGVETAAIVSLVSSMAHPVTTEPVSSLTDPTPLSEHHLLRPSIIFSGADGSEILAYNQRSHYEGAYSAAQLCETAYENDQHAARNAMAIMGKILRCLMF